LKVLFLIVTVTLYGSIFAWTGKSLNSPCLTILPYSLSGYDLADRVVFSTYFGGTDQAVINDIATDELGASYITGITTETDFPTKNALNSTFNGGTSDSFIAKFNSDGTLNYSTYFGGNNYEESTDIAVDPSGAFYITGYTESSNFPIKNAIQSVYNGNKDAFIAKFNANGTLNYSTYFGGSLSDIAYSIAVDSRGTCYVTGRTYSSNFPLLNPFDSSRGGSSDAFITILNPDGTLNFSSYLGGSSDDFTNGIGIDADGSFYITGSTQSLDYPQLDAIFSRKPNREAFVTKFNADQSLNFSSYIGGSFDDDASDISVLPSGRFFIVGSTLSDDFPLKNAFDPFYRFAQAISTFVLLMHHCVFSGISRLKFPIQPDEVTLKVLPLPGHD